MADIVLCETRQQQDRVIVGKFFGLRFGFFGAEPAARCRFIFVDYFIVVERWCNQTVKPEREIRTTINQIKTLCRERVRQVKQNKYLLKMDGMEAAGFIFLWKI